MLTSYKRRGKCVVLKTSTRQTIFLPVVGLVDTDALKPADLVGVNKVCIPQRMHTWCMPRRSCRVAHACARTLPSAARACAAERCCLQRSLRSSLLPPSWG